MLRTELVQEPRRTFDVREQERDHSRRQIALKLAHTNV